MNAGLPGWLWPFVAFSGVGAFIDFVLGKSGQERCRSLLETWWIKFEDVRWNNFGRKEAELATRVIDGLAGKRWYSWRRWVFSTTAFSLIIATALIIIKIAQANVEVNNNFPLREWYLYYLPYLPVLFSFILLIFSISINRKIAAIIARLCSNDSSYNVALFVLFLFLSYCLMVLWMPFVMTLGKELTSDITTDIYFLTYTGVDPHARFSDFIYAGWESLVKPIKEYEYELSIELFYPQTLFESFYQKSFAVFPIYHESRPERIVFFFPVEFIQITSAYLANGARLLLALIFVGSVLLRQLLMNPASLIWRRIVESDKPIFTLAFGGIGAAASGLGAILKYI